MARTRFSKSIGIKALGDGCLVFPHIPFACRVEYDAARHNYPISKTNRAEKVKEHVGPGPSALTPIGFYTIVV
jgi:hypothetical protein